MMRRYDSKPTVGIIDYEVGNIYSVAKAVDYLGAKSLILTRGEDIERCSVVILPGVGSFGHGINSIRARGFFQPLKSLASDRSKIFIGICLGFQLLFESSEESPEETGLSLLPGTISQLSDGGLGQKVTNVGFRDCFRKQASGRFESPSESSPCYFVHRYAYRDAANPFVTSISYDNIGKPFVSSIQNDNLFGFQFHPEKSKYVGLSILRDIIFS